MNVPQTVELLLHKAEQDEAVLRELLTSSSIDDETLGFHAQQAVEKYLKAWLCRCGIDYPKIHNLDLLAELLVSNGKSLPDELDDIGLLTPYATVFRYDDLPVSSGMARDDMLSLVGNVREFVLSEVQPAE